MRILSGSFSSADSSAMHLTHLQANTERFSQQFIWTLQLISCVCVLQTDSQPVTASHYDE